MSLALVIFSLLLFALIAYILRLRFKRNLVIAWCAAAVVINIFFLVELVLNFVALGPLRSMSRQKTLIIELMLQVVCLVSDSYFLDGNYISTVFAINLCCCVILVRLTRLFYLFAEIKSVNVILSTFLRFTMPFIVICLSLYTLFFFFAQLGMLLFGGAITTVSQQIGNDFTPPLWYLMNFNDFAASCITLFHILIVNNWYVTCDMYCYVFNSWLPRIFFVTFWILTVLIMLNIVIAFVLDVYHSVASDVEKEYIRRDYVKQFRRKFSD